MKSIHVHGKRWFHASDGNTYHSVTVWVDGEEVGREAFAYGYGSQYLQTASDILAEHNPDKFKLADGRSVYPLSRYCRENGIHFVDEVTDVPRKKDL